MATEATGNKKYFFIFFLFLFIFFAVYFAYFFIKNEQSEETFQVEPYREYYQTGTLLKDLNQIDLKPIQKAKNSMPKIPKDIDTLMKEEGYTQNSLDANNSDAHIEKEKKTIKASKKKPKLVIIIDDIHTQNQIDAIKALKMKITPSIFPPYHLAKHSYLLAKNLKHSMIHLPMESDSKQFNTQSKTLMTAFSSQQIVESVIKLRKLFPKTKFVNSHTGSVFTSHFKAMQKLYITLKVEGFTFVDSFTTASSQVKKIAEGFGDVYLKRDVFIDNTQEIPYIHTQLKKAVNIAKEHGYAIAIGHPHKATMEALASAKHILKDVTLLYIDELKVGS